MFLNNSSVTPAASNGQCRGKPQADRQEHGGDEHGGGAGLAIARQEEPTAEQSCDQGIAAGRLWQVGRFREQSFQTPPIRAQAARTGR